jgi:hypothetical protein
LGGAEIESMKPKRKDGEGRGAKATDSARLQPAEVPQDWLRPFDATHEAEALEDYARRLKGDQELVHDLQWDGYAGPRWERFAEVLVAYGYQVLLAWIVTGTVFAKCRVHGLRGVGPHAVMPIGRQDAEELAWASLGFAVTAFRDKVLKPRVWTAAGGATLKTFFIGQVLIQFVPIYKSWARQTRAAVPTDYLLDAPDPSILGRPEDSALAVVEAGLVFGAVSASGRPLLALTGLGYSQEEIAELLGLGSAKAVEARLYRIRTRLRESA